jgi:NRPS condensation-like uncharacterized protein
MAENYASRFPPAASPEPFALAENAVERLPLSSQQWRFWFLDHLLGGGGEYTVTKAWHIRGALDRLALKRAVQTIVDRQESLRTRFEDYSEGPRQLIIPELPVEMPEEDVSHLAETSQRRAIETIVRNEASQRFDLRLAPLFRTRLVKLGETEHVFIRAMHHIICDGWSAAIFARELGYLYNAFRHGRENALSPLSFQYRDYTRWQVAEFQGKKVREGLAYWKKNLTGFPDCLGLPMDRRRQEAPTLAAAACSVALSENQVAALRSLGRKNGATLYMVLLAAFGLLLSRYSGQDDLAVGSPIANRQDGRFYDVIGCFVNTIVLRMQVEPAMTFRELLEQVQPTVLDALRYCSIPFESLVEELAPERKLNMNALFQVVFALHNVPQQRPQLDELEVEPFEIAKVKVRFDLEVHAFEDNGKVRLYWIYNQDLFNPWRIEGMASQYVTMLQAVIANPNQMVGEVDLA